MQTVGELSELAGVTVRTLHHYDEIGLLCPSERSDAGYRLYGYEDAGRLQEIIVWRQLGFSLAEIQRLLDDPAHDRFQALRRQRQLVEHELERLCATARALDAALSAHHNGTRLEVGKMFEGFDPAEHEQEVGERWGHTEAYGESRRRTADYGEQEWAEIRAESDQIVSEFARLMTAGEPPTGGPARAVAERHRQQISERFYPCSPAMHSGLAEMYIADQRFADNYERVADGLAQYVHDAILANAER